MIVITVKTSIKLNKPISIITGRNEEVRRCSKSLMSFGFTQHADHKYVVLGTVKIYTETVIYMYFKKHVQLIVAK